jgi:hypothetical protein
MQIAATGKRGPDMQVSSGTLDFCSANKMANSGFSQCARRSRKCEYPTISRRGLREPRDNSSNHRGSEDAD